MLALLLLGAVGAARGQASWVTGRDIYHDGLVIGATVYDSCASCHGAFRNPGSIRPIGSTYYDADGEADLLAKMASNAMSAPITGYLKNHSGLVDSLVAYFRNPKNLEAPTAALAFGNANGVNTTATRTVSLSNLARIAWAKLSVTGIDADGPFSATGCSNVDAGGVCQITVDFHPTAAGRYTGTLTIRHDGAGGSVALAVSGGTPVPEPALSAPSADFPDTAIGSIAIERRTLRIDNPRSHDLGFAFSALGDFSVGGNSCAALRVPAGGHCDLDIDFRPTGTSESRRTQTVTVSYAPTGGDPPAADASFTLAGKALLPLGLSAGALSIRANLQRTATGSIQLVNRGTSPLTLNEIAPEGGAAAPDFNVDPSGDCQALTVIAPGRGCTLVVAYTARVDTTQHATLRLRHSAVGSGQTVTLTGLSDGAIRAHLVVGDTRVTFADTAVRGTSAASLVLRNTGDLDLHFRAFDIVGTEAAEFTTGTGCSAAAPLPGGASCTLALRFAPAAEGDRSANLQIGSDADGPAPVIVLAGHALPEPRARLGLPATIDFGTQAIGGAYASRSFELRNDGDAALAIGRLTTAPAAYVIDNPSACPASLAPGQRCVLSLSFHPDRTDPFPGQLQVESNAVGTPHALVLSGRGSATAAPQLAWATPAGTLDFGEVLEGAVSAPQSVTLVNQGPGGARLGVIQAAGTDAVAFAVVGGSCTPGLLLYEGAQCRIELQFAPAGPGARSAALQLPSDGNPPPSVSLAGRGLGSAVPTLTLSTDSLAFGSVGVGSRSVPLQLRLTASGSGEVEVRALSVDGPFELVAASCPPPPFRLSAGSSCNAGLLYRADAAGLHQGTLSVMADVRTTPWEVALSGATDTGPARPSSGGGGGGCTIAPPGSAHTDPTLWLLVGAAALIIAQRRRAGALSAHQR